MMAELHGSMAATSARWAPALYWLLAGKPSGSRARDPQLSALAAQRKPASDTT